ncbi:MAG: hypothetical protein Q9160_001077 [Pyrenula sp. 1 TL-2023]
METIAVYCSWADAQLFSKPDLTRELPSELLSTIRHQSGKQYLNALSSALLIPQCTDRLFLLYEPVALDLLARASDVVENVTDTIELLCAAARLLPYNPSLKGFVRALLISDDDPFLGFLSNPADFRLASFGSTILQSLLLALFRLFSFDLDTFRVGVAPVLLSSLCRHEDVPTRYLANRCLAMYMQMTDAASQHLLRLNLQNDPLKGRWENKDIDYRFLSLYEEERWDELTNAILRARQDRTATANPSAKDINITALSPKISVLGEVLLLRQAGLASSASSLVLTRTTIYNMTQVGRALLNDGPIVLMGPAGSGKTSLIREAARAQNKLSSMVTLYLNEQTDAKSLLGLYTTTPQGGSFTWQAGVLTQAVKDGRWVLVENLDRASSEVMSILIPLIEQGELLIASRRERVRASPGFKILATIRTRPNVSREAIGTTSSILGGRLWQTVPISPLDIDDAQSIVLQMFSMLRPHCDMILRILERVRGLKKSLKAQSDGLRETLRWCRRMQTRLERADIHTSDDMIPGSLYDDFLLDAVDCYAGAIPSGEDRDTVRLIIAEELQCSPQRLEFLLHDRRPEISDLPSQVKIGKEDLPKPAYNRHNKTQLQPFAKTRHFRALLESVAACVCHSEPTLLVGETGIGKTAVLQYLAALTRQQMIVINLSQQSESADLIGGFKPVSVRSILLPLAEDFDILFDDTFSSRRNEAFLASIRKSVVKNNWHRLLLLWDEAVRMAEDTITRKLAFQEQTPSEPTSNEYTDKPAKRRRIDVAKFVSLRTRWAEFTERAENVRARVSGKDQRFAFSFVEGKLVTALRRGHWVLLDEINLATSETLVAISSILNHGVDGSPSILLSDAGHVDQIMGNPSFRVFASMNPSTDIGKRELPPALRSKFTELFVDSPDRDLHDLTALIETYIGSFLTSDRRAGPDLAQLYVDAKKLAEQNLLSDGAGQKPHFSVRTLVRSLLYVTDHAPIYGFRRAMYEGFSMSFMTVLNIESEKRLSLVLDRRILGNHRNARSTLSQTPRPPTKSDNFVQFRHYWVAKGASNPVSQPHYVVTPFVERNLLNLARATSMKRFPILLQGPTSSGKTSLIEYLANISGNKFVRINNHEHTDLQEYLGDYSSGSDGKLHYKDGVLVDAIRHGKWVVLDELNLAPTDVLEALNRLLDDNRELLVPETQEIIRPHPHFMLFATQNPAGLYGGRKHLSRAFRNRFLELHFDDIPETELETILRERSRIAPSYCANIVTVYKKLSLLRQSSKIFEQRHSFVTLRDLFRWALRSAEDKQELALNGFMLLGERVRDPAEKVAVKNIIEDVFRVVINESNLYAARFHSNIIESTRGSLTWTPAMRRLYGLVSKALDNNEPVLLIGETGCGKTQLCQAIAQAHQKPLKTVNAHSNTEAGDLLGAQRPVRNRASTERLLIDDLQTVLTLSGRQQHLLNVDLESLLVLFKSLSDQFLQTVDGNILSRIRNNITKLGSLFEWIDGSLTDAMKEGHYFLLDEISLADDSVLERLNSVLEPSRTLFLAEKGTAEPEIIATKGFQFMATMNPGGDHGKRELSAALRNRLTEIWVPDLTEDEDILPILHERLQSFSMAPKVMVAFAKWFHGRFYSTSRCEISLRDLLSWADFINQQVEAEILQSITQGAFLVYIDALGADPAGSTSILSSQIADVRAECLEYLNQLLGYESSHFHDHGHLQIALKDHILQIGPFSIARNGNGNNNPNFVFEAPTILENAMRILRALQVSKPILLEGNPGVGKTAIIQALADTLGKSLTRINLSEQTDLMDLFGSDVPQQGGSAGRFAWQDGPFLKAMQSGGWVLLDEMNLASQSILEGLNSCIDHRQEVYVAELGQTFRRHPDFVLFGAQNSHHQAGGRKGLPLSFVNRFTVVYADVLDFDDLEVISKTSFPQIPPEIITQVVRFATTYNTYFERKRLFERNISLPDLNLRDILRWLALCQSRNLRFSPRHYLDMILSQRLRTADQKEEIARLWQTTFQEERYYHSYYHNITRGHYQVGLGFMRRATPSICRIPNIPDISLRSLPVQESLLLCIEHKWPVILAGNSGCGKSSLLRALASVRGTALMELGLSRDTDSIDLIGGFEQLDYDRLIQEALGKVLDVIQLEIASTHFKPADADYRQLLRLYHLGVERKAAKQTAQDLLRLSQNQPALQLYTKDLENLVRQAQSTSDVTFQWVDGMLIDALETGKWVILDNANLCNPSVLDRLNSLLEFDGYLVVNEQHATNGSERVIRPHPDFRIFLTVDPRHGELSRAMRNRSVELYMSDEHWQAAPFRTPKYFAEADLSRIRLHEHVKRTMVLNQNKQAVLDAAMDIIAPIDISHASQFTIPDNDDWIRFDIGKRLMSKTYSLDTADSSVKIFSGKDRIEIDILAEEQPYRTLANEPLLQLRTSGTVSEAQRSYHWLQGKYVELLVAENFLRDSENAVQALEKSQMTVLQRSIASLRIGRQGREASTPIAQFFAEILRSMNGILSKMPDLLSSLPQQSLDAVDYLFNWFEKMVYVTGQNSIEEAHLRSYVDLGYKIFIRVNQLLPDIAPSLDRVHSHTLQGLSLCSGQGLQRMWPYWRPKTASDAVRARAHVTIERVATCIEASFSAMALDLERAVNCRLALEDGCRQLLNDKAIDLRTIEAIGSLVDDVAKLPVEKERGTLRLSTERLCQFRDAQNLLLRCNQPDSEKNQKVSALAGRPIDLLGEYGSTSFVPFTLTSIAGFAGWKNNFHAESVTDCSASLQMLHDIEKVHLEPISMLQPLDVDLRTFTHALSIQTASISANNLSSIREGTRRILEAVVDSHSDFARIVCSEDTTGCSIRIENNVSEDHYFRVVVRKYLTPALRFLHQPVSRSSNKLSSGAALFGTSLAALHLLVPDKPFDPAVQAIVEKELHNSRSEKLKTQLAGLEAFEDFFSGQKTNLRCMLIEENIERMGNEPSSPPVFRPVPSELNDLQNEFSNVLHSVLRRDQEIFLRQGLVNGEGIRSTVDQRRQEYESLRQNVLIASSRLKLSSSYQDLAVPVMRTLQCLELGARLIVHSEQTHSNFESALLQLSDTIPLAGAKPNTMLNAMPASSYIDLYDVSYTSTYNLAVHVADFVLRQKSASKISNLERVFQKSYEEWKYHLERDQTLAAKRSKFYHYRGEAEDDNVAEDMQRLFPDFALIHERKANAEHSASYSPRVAALKLATAHEQLFGAKIDVLGNLLYTSLDSMMSLMSRSALETSSLPDDRFLSLVYLQLKRTTDHMSGRSGQNLVDVYADPNVPEIRNLVKLVHSIRKRFYSISDTWPEHATPRDVLLCCSELLAVKMNDPIMKTLLKTEKLHATMSEWQKVASSQFSITSLLEEVTSLIINWRKLEMMSWASLLEAEDQRARDEAMSWWFLLYEIIIAIPKQATESNDFEDHIIEMTATLDNFIGYSPIGQYGTRMTMLGMFAWLLHIQGSNTMQSAVSNVLKYHNRRSSEMSKTVGGGKAQLARDIKEQITLTSWKDTNVVALRESAKKSHHKLFKIVRKYRALIDQPASNITTTTETPNVSQERNISTKYAHTLRRSLDSSILTLCQDSIVNWESRPDRLRDFDGAAASMSQLYQRTVPALNLAEELEYICASFAETTDQLRKETPGNLTDDNSQIVRQLKARKRRCLADTFRSLRKMGLPSNLNSRELGQQSTTAKALATIADFDSKTKTLEEADHFYYTFLDLVSKIRMTSRQHNEDLTSTDVMRGCGFSEGLLYVLRKQRNALSAALQGVELVKGVIAQIEHLNSSWSEVSFQRLSALSKSREARLVHALQWLPNLLNLSCSIASTQQTFSEGDLDFTSITAGLNHHAGIIQDERDAFNNEFSDRHSTLRNSAELDRTEKAIGKLTVLRQDLESWSCLQPQVGYLMRQIIPWTDLEAYPEDFDRESEIKMSNGIPRNQLESTDRKMSVALDKIFVSMQQVSQEGKDVASSTEDIRWFTSSESSITGQLKALHMEEIHLEWQNVLSGLGHVHESYLQPSIALCILTLPVLEQYLSICRNLVERYAIAHNATSRLSFVLGRAFSQILADGFCSPLNSSTEGGGEESKVEMGTGLGEGEGAEDISKDVGEDEDLSEFTNQEKKELEGEEIDAEENAVDMGREDLEGNMDERGEFEKADDEVDDADENDEGDEIDEEAGSVDNLDPAAIDEKLWEGLAKEDEKELENEDAKGKGSKEQSDRQQSEQQKLQDDQDLNDAEEEATDGEDIVPEEMVNEHESIDHMDPHMQQEKQIDLPDDMQLDGDKGEQEDSVTDDAIDELSDVEAEREEEGNDQLQDIDESATEEDLPEPKPDAMAEEVTQGEEDDGVEEDDNVDPLSKDSAAKQQEDDSHVVDPDLALQDDSGTAGEMLGDPENVDVSNSASSDSNPNAPQNSEQQDSMARSGTHDAKPEGTTATSGRADTAEALKQQETFKKLGDILEQWHRQTREIFPSYDEHDPISTDVEMADVDFEHVKDEGDRGETQALGAGSKDEARELDESKAIEDPHTQPTEDQQMHDATTKNGSAPPAPPEDTNTSEETQQTASLEDTNHGAFIPNRDQPLDTTSALTEELLDSLPDEQLPIPPPANLPPPSASITHPSLGLLWPYYSSLTHTPSLQLSNRLRLLLPPTTATKLRGDYRTGKRLNMKRIIPFIASGYRRDKIWLRRTLPSKRNYQIVLAVDDSRSMLEGPPATTAVEGAPGGVAGKALEALALVAKGLSALDIGDNLAIVAFGGSSSSAKTPDASSLSVTAATPSAAIGGVRIAHPFGVPFTDSAGPSVFAHFTFRQSGTDVVGLVKRCVAMFHDARQNMPSSFGGAGEETWQLAIVVGDGIFDRHEEVKRLVRGASEERIAFVYVVVDNQRSENSGDGGQSILDLQRATFDASTSTGGGDGSAAGGGKLVMKTYLETFPFGFYVVVREVGELGGVLCEVLRGWFGEAGGGV